MKAMAVILNHAANNSGILDKAKKKSPSTNRIYE